MDIRRIKQACKYGWKDALALSKEEGGQKGRMEIFLDILQCFFKYNVWSNQYKKEKLHLLSSEAKKEICLKYQEKNTKRDRWVKEFFDNYKFLNKWSDFKYERSAVLQTKRRIAYKIQYGLGSNCFIGYDVIFHKHHYVDSTLVTEENCGFSEHVDVDYTGGLQLEKNVWISEGAKILTHNHSIGLESKGLDKGCILTPLVIHDGAWIGTRAIIMPGVKEIGRCAIISADSHVHTKIPPYSIVLGNPAKIVGFRGTPEEIIKHEKETYPERERTPPEILEKNYEKFFIRRLNEIKQITKL